MGYIEYAVHDSVTGMWYGSSTSYDNAVMIADCMRSLGIKPVIKEVVRIFAYESREDPK